MGELLIYINPQKAWELDQNLTLQELYYRPESYYQTAEKMFVIKDVATRFHRNFALTNKSSAQVAKAFQRIYDDLNCTLILPNVLIVNRDTIWANLSTFN
ncbi:hypothetical protein RIR_jg7319.t1 [Rhizophagus irregularis DAOM 181602=DAOM 197198]|nr:hypothetical protein RIR_jg7319.t1 [Rhizophagus irregularis DAOM 181602=DAOM 197198]